MAVATLVDSLQIADVVRAQNRARINATFNGLPPYTAAEADEGQIDTNVNFLQGARITADARGKLYSALFGDNELFSVTLTEGEEEFRDGWQMTITNKLNEIIRGSLVYIEEQRQKCASLILHGIAPMIWDHPDRWCPYFSSLENTKIPDRTLVSLRNLEFFFVYRQYTPSQLQAKIDSKSAGWDVKRCEGLIDGAVKQTVKTLQDTSYVWKPELQEQDWKANSGFWASSTCATIDTWECYYKDDKDKIQLKVIPWYADGAGLMPNVSPQEARDRSNFGFLYESKKPLAEEFCEVMALSVTDGNTVAPFRIDTVRSLGFLLFSLVNLDNRMRSKLFDSTFENLLTYYKNIGGGASDALPAFKLQNYGMLPDGYTPVPAAERHSINEPLVAGSLSNLRQMMSEFSASFTEDLSGTGSNPQETATAVIAKVNAASALLSSMLTMAYIYQTKEDEEVCRRFCKKGSTDKDVKYFQKCMKDKGVPEELLDVEYWKIRRNKPIGGGNKTVEMLQVQKLMEARGAYDEPAQRQILRKFTQSATDDPELAMSWVPVQADMQGNAVQIASFAMGSLMQGLPVIVPQSIARGQFTQALLQLSQVIVQRIEQNGGMATKEEVIGLSTVVKEVQEQIQIIAQDPTKKQAVKILGDQLGQLANMVKGYAQRLAEQQSQQNGGVDPETAAAIEKARIAGQSQAAINEMVAKNKQTQKNISFQQAQEQKAAKAQQDMQIKALNAHQDLAIKGVNTRADIALADASTAAEINRG